MDNKNNYNKLKQIFSQSAENNRLEFSDILKNLMVITTEDLIYASPEISNTLEKNPEILKVNFNKASMIFHDDPLSLAITFPKIELEKTKTAPIIMINTDQSKIYNEYDIMYFSFILDHEIAHLVVKEADNHPDYIEESAADIYASLCQIKKHGSTTDLLKELVKEMASASVAGITRYYTSAGIQASIEVGEKNDLRGTSLKELSKLTSKLTKKYHLTEQMVLKLDDAFASTKLIMAFHGFDTALYKETVRIMVNNKNDEDIYRAGKLFLSTASSKNFIENESKNDTFWNKAQEYMERHEKDTEFLLNPARAMEKKLFSSKNSSKKPVIKTN